MSIENHDQDETPQPLAWGLLLSLLALGLVLVGLGFFLDWLAVTAK